MQEITKTLITQLQTDWNLAGDIAKEHITFRRGEPANLSNRFMPNKISIEAKKIMTAARKRSLARSKFTEPIPISIWQLIQPKTDANIATLLDERQQIIDEIRRIIKLRQTSMSGIALSYQQNERYLDDYDGLPPTLRVIITILCTYCV